MQRDPGRLEGHFDVLVVGAGVYGASIAWDAAQRGLSVALVDRGDFGGGTSFNNAKTVHGGVRSLQRGAIGELRQYVRERRALCRVAPHLVHPLPFMVPTQGHLHRSRAAMALYFDLYDLLAADRNAGVPRSRRLPASYLLSRRAAAGAHPALAGNDGLTGAAVWHDGQLLSSERVGLAFIGSAVGAGAVAINYVELVGLEVHGRRIQGARLRDTLSGRELQPRATIVVNATGPGAHDVLRLALPRPPRVFDTLSLAMNVVVPSFDTRMAVGGMARGRLLFLAPWRHVTVGGTSHDPIEGDPSAVRVTRPRVEALLQDLNAAFPGAKLRLDDVRLVHRGLLPSHTASGPAVSLVKDSIVRDHHADGVDGLVSVVGTRYTTARHTAEQCVDLVFARLGRRAPPCRTAHTPLAGGDVGDPESFAATVIGSGHAPAASERLLRLYGTSWSAVAALIDERPPLGERLGAACDTIGAEIVHAARAEMAVHLADALLRRTGAGTAGHPGTDAVRAAAALMKAERGWSDEETERQIAAFERVYAIEE